MKFDISRINGEYSFVLSGVSFIGDPRDNTILFVTSKVGHFLSNLEKCKNCLVFVEEDLEIPESYEEKNCIIRAKDPQLEYAKLAVQIATEEREKEKNRKYTLTDGGYYIGENTQIGENCIIGENCRIGHDVVIGNNASIGFGSVISHSTIGDDFSCMDHCSIGIDAFFFADGEKKFRIPSFGKVFIGNNVDFSSHVILERGFNSDTVISDNTKIDSGVCLGHDVHLGENVFIVGGTNIAGLVHVGKNTYIGMNATIKQRLEIGENAVIGMGAAVIADVKPGTHVFGNPAKRFGV